MRNKIIRWLTRLYYGRLFDSLKAYVQGERARENRRRGS